VLIDLTVLLPSLTCKVGERTDTRDCIWRLSEGDGRATNLGFSDLSMIFFRVVDGKDFSFPMKVLTRSNP
jgi:hypothetical protein